ncbi:MAG: prepilin-type N-terminal cleavage/methylation domain-containing protein [Candidatus Anstonellales archaeon]
MRKKKKGISLIEVVVAVAITVVLASVAVKLIADKVEQTKVQKTRVELSGYIKSIDLYRNDKGDLPSSKNDLTDYLRNLSKKNPYNGEYKYVKDTNGDVYIEVENLPDNVKSKLEEDYPNNSRIVDNNYRYYLAFGSVPNITGDIRFKKIVKNYYYGYDMVGYAGITNDGDVYVWGDTVTGWLGVGSTHNKRIGLTKVNISDVKDICLGYTSFILTNDGKLYYTGNMMRSNELGYIYDTDSWTLIDTDVDSILFASKAFMKYKKKDNSVVLFKGDGGFGYITDGYVPISVLESADNIKLLSFLNNGGWYNNIEEGLIDLSNNTFYVDTFGSLKGYSINNVKFVGDTMVVHNDNTVSIMGLHYDNNTFTYELNEVPLDFDGGGVRTILGTADNFVLASDGLWVLGRIDYGDNKLYKVNIPFTLTSIQSLNSYISGVLATDTNGNKYIISITGDILDGVYEDEYYIEGVYIYKLK